MEYLLPLKAKQLAACALSHQENEHQCSLNAF
jgi:hypothetical protein